MNKVLSYAMLSSLLIFSAACKKDDPAPATPTPAPATACNGKSLCFKMDGTEVSKDAKLREINVNNVVRNRVYWEDAATGSNIEIDIYGTTTGTYTIAASPATGQAGFQYYLKENGTTKNIQGSSGSINVTALANGTISGTFTATASDGTKTYQITDGNFVNVAK